MSESADELLTAISSGDMSKMLKSLGSMLVARESLGERPYSECLRTGNTVPSGSHFDYKSKTDKNKGKREMKFP